uniref:Thioredoxin n=1 Tax=Cristaria plicata TaxID=165446 RepID=M1S071_CRIPL|nr:thioredoxin [Cristaria plicata]
MINRTTPESEFNSIVKGSGDKLVVVDFTATWCGPCQRIAPLFAEMAEEMKDVIFIKVDVDQNEETASACKINAMPTFQFYKNGQKLEEFSGADINKLRQVVAKHK